eukprot:UN23948
MRVYDKQEFAGGCTCGKLLVSWNYVSFFVVCVMILVFLLNPLGHLQLRHHNLQIYHSDDFTPEIQRMKSGMTVEDMLKIENSLFQERDKIYITDKNNDIRALLAVFLVITAVALFTNFWYF